MKRTLLIFACLLLAFIAWVFPYIDELRDQGLTMDTAYGYFFGGPDHPFDPNDATAGVGHGTAEGQKESKPKQGRVAGCTGKLMRTSRGDH